MITLRILKWRDYILDSGGPNVITRVLLGRSEAEAEEEVDDTAEVRVMCSVARSRRRDIRDGFCLRTSLDFGPQELSL